MEGAGAEGEGFGDLEGGVGVGSEDPVTAGEVAGGEAEREGWG